MSHGGSGTFLASLAAELPQLCVPQAADQFFNAAACAQAGAGIALSPGGVTSEQVTDAVERLLSDPTFRTAATGISNEIAAMPSPQAVADHLHSEYG